MLRRSVHRREGMTLVELLVVIGIVVTLMALLIGAVMKALDVLPRTDTAARITTSASASSTFQANGSFGGTRYPIPAGRWEGGTWQPFRLRNNYPAVPAAGQPGGSSFEAQYIIEVFGTRPTMSSSGPELLNLSGGDPMTETDLDANQTFTFFLTGMPTDKSGNQVFTGFCSDPQTPFKLRVDPAETRKGPVLDLTGKQKYTFTAPDGFTNNYAWLVDGYSFRTPAGVAVPGTPYAYFATYKGQRNKYGTNGGCNNHFGTSVPYPYARAEYENPIGFQLISAGKDRTFGAVGTNGNWAAVTPAGMDDQSNFSSSLLGAGPQ